MMKALAPDHGEDWALEEGPSSSAQRFRTGAGPPSSDGTRLAATLG